MDTEKEELKIEKVKSETEKLINCLVEDELQVNDVDLLGKLVDIHKDLANEDYWKDKEEVYKMRYNDYNDYGRRGVPGTGRRYRGEYGRRGVKGTGRGRYRGYDRMDEMQDHYDNYNDASEEMERGNYGAENDMVKSVEGIMKNIYEIVEELTETESPEVTRIIKKYARKINEMD